MIILVQNYGDIQRKIIYICIAQFYKSKSAKNIFVTIRNVEETTQSYLPHQCTNSALNISYEMTCAFQRQIVLFLNHRG